MLAKTRRIDNYEAMNIKQGLSTSGRIGARVPAEFIEVKNLLWTTPFGEKECPTAIYQLRSNKLGLNLLRITDMVVTCQEEAFGVEVAYEHWRFDPNMLIMGSLSLTATLEAWHNAHG